MLILALPGCAFFGMWLLPDALYLAILGPGAVSSVLAIQVILLLIA